MMKKDLIAIWFLMPVLTLGPALTCVAPRVMAALFIACAVLGVVADCIARRARPEVDRGLAALLGAVLVYGFASTLWSINPGETPGKAGQLAAIFAPLVCLVPVIGRQRAEGLRLIGRGLGVGLALGIAVFISEMMTGFALWDLVRGGPTNDAVDNKQNKVAVLAALWAYMAFPFFVPRAGTAARIAFLAGVPLLFFVTFVAKSESAKLILLCAPFMAAGLYVLPERLARRFVFAATVGLVVFMPLLAFQGYHTGWRENAALNGSVKSRIEIWHQAASRAMEKPVFGWGLDSASEMPNRDDESYIPGRPIAHLHPHNAPLQIWFELGATGVAMAIALFIAFYRRIGTMSNMGADTGAQKYAVFMWGAVFLYTLSIWGIWQSWFVATLALAGLMTYAGARQISLTRTL